MKLVACLIALVLLLLIGPALAGPTGLLSKQRASKLYLKKAKAKRLYGPDISQTEADARYLQPGKITFTTGPNNWVLGPVTHGPTPQIDYFSDATRVRTSAETTAFLQLQPDLPSLLYNRPMTLTSAEVCFTSSGDAQITSVALSASQAQLLADASPSQDCQSYEVSYALKPQDTISLTLQAFFSGSANASLFLERATFALSG